MAGFTILISAQNTRYQAWMALVAAYSARRWHEARTVVAVAAAEDEPLLPEFSLLGPAGIGVVRHRDYTNLHGSWYLVRNAPGALLEAEVDDDFVVLCDPDMVFLRTVPFARLGADLTVLTMDKSGYMRADHGDNRVWLGGACRRLGVDYEALVARGTFGGVPHVIHGAVRRRLAEAWIETIAAFDRVDPDSDQPIHWTAAMWALVLTADRLGIDILVTDMQQHNYDDLFLEDKLPIIHYCHGDRDFAKRSFMGDATARSVWDVLPLGTGTVSDRVRGEIAAAALFYGLDHQGERRRLLGDPP